MQQWLQRWLLLAVYMLHVPPSQKVDVSSNLEQYRSGQV